jgi:hypothetical protein|tara:strand:+ start:548 stop:661 length:114 start_codon:yes stop_codon:yes gene_type:complete
VEAAVVHPLLRRVLVVAVVLVDIKQEVFHYLDRLLQQ